MGLWKNGEVQRNESTIEKTRRKEFLQKTYYSKRKHQKTHHLCTREYHVYERGTDIIRKEE